MAGCSGEFVMHHILPVRGGSEPAVLNGIYRIHHYSLVLLPGYWVLLSHVPRRDW